MLKVANFNLLHLHLAPPLGVTPFEFCRDLRHQTLGSRVALFTFRRFSRTSTCDRQTDRHNYGIYRASMASRGKNYFLKPFCFLTSVQTL